MTSVSMFRPAGRLLTALPVLFWLAACSSTPDGDRAQAEQEPRAQERMAEQLDAMAPEARADEPRTPAPAVPAELDDMVLDLEPDGSRERFDVAASEVELAQFLNDLAEIANTNILLDSGVTGTVSLRLRDVTVQDVMHALQDQKGIAFERTDYGYRVSGDQMQTRMFRVNYLDIQRSGSSSTGINTGQIASGGGQSSQLDTRNETDFWGTLEATLQMMMGAGDGRQLVINRQTGLIVVKAPPSELRTVSDFLREAELALQQQVIIEARVLEVRLSDTFASGIDWSILGDDIGGVSGLDIGAGVSGSSPSDPDLDGVFNLSLSLRNFNSVIRALRTQGEVEVLSSPRISTVNNQKAMIKVGSEEQFINVSSVATSNSDGESQLDPSFTLEPYFSGIALDVTPQIADNEQIILHVHPSVIQVTATTRSFTIQGESFNLPVASSTIRETDSVVRANNGQVVVIGGLLQNSITSLRSGVPGEGRGLLRWLLGQERESSERTELIILLRPAIADADSFEEDIRNTSTRLLDP